MTLLELDRYFNSFLKKEEFSGDISLNGIQVENSAPDSKPVGKVAFAVDACLESIQKAAELGAQALFVHHGIFWGRCETITGARYARISALLRNDIALYASHIPLDANREVGNNFGLARRLGLVQTEAAGIWRGMTFGAKGLLPKPLCIEEIVPLLFPNGEIPQRILKFGKEQVNSVMILSGGTGSDIGQALEAGADLFVCGELGHEQYHFARENKMNVIAGGHYNTETVGVRLVAERLESETGLETAFIDLPTGL